MDSAEADRGGARVDVGPVVVGVGDGQRALVLLGVAVGVADEGGLVVVVELGVGDGDKSGGMGDVEEAVVEVLARAHVGGEIAVVDPDLGGLLDTDGIAVGSLDLAELHVSDDDIGHLVDIQADAGERRALGTDDGLVGSDADLGRAGDGALDDNDQGVLGLSSRAELGERGNSGGRSSGTTGGARSETNVASVRDRSTLERLLEERGCRSGQGGGEESANGGELRELHDD